MARNRYCFIVNPAAGGGLAGRNWPLLRQELRTAGINHCDYVSEHNGHCHALARAAYEAGERQFVAVGGDGTANAVLNGVLSVAGADAAGFSLGAVPWGTGNDWASYYGVPHRTEAVLRMLREGATTRQDLGRATLTDSPGATRSHYFLNCAGTGIDSFLLKEMKDARGSRLRYFLYALKCLRSYRAVSVALDMGMEAFEGPALLLEVCLGKFAGAGMQFAPDAVADDGLFDVLLIEALSIPRVLLSLVYLYNGRINEHRAAHHWQCSSLSIETAAAPYLHCDGELVGRLPVEIELMPNALTVLTHGDSPGPSQRRHGS